MRNQKDGVFSNVAMKLFTNFANVLLQSMQLIQEKVEENQIVYNKHKYKHASIINTICKKLFNL